MSRRCTCRHNDSLAFYSTESAGIRSKESMKEDDTSSILTSRIERLALEESFVHLPRGFHLPLDEPIINNNGSNIHSENHVATAFGIRKSKVTTNQRNNTMSFPKTCVQKHIGLLDACNHVSELVNLCTSYLEDDGHDEFPKPLPLPPSLCTACVDRVISAIEININQLQGESEIYKAALATKEREMQQRRMKERQEITPRSIASNDGEDEIDKEKEIVKECAIIDDDDETASSFFEKELQLLSSAVRVHEQELNMLEGRLTEQCKISQQIAMQEEQLQQELRYFEYYTQHVWTRVQRPVLTNYMKRAQDEFDAISSLQLPSLLFDVSCPLLPKKQDQKVSESSYSKINYLRLSHLPCAKLNLTWDEINAAWSQAAQLIFMVGAAVNFVSSDLRIVPLTKCAKIIQIIDPTKQTQLVHNLGIEVDHDDFKNKNHSRRREDETAASKYSEFLVSLCAFHRLLHQIVLHIQQQNFLSSFVLGDSSVNNDVPSSAIPFLIEEERIGGLILSPSLSSDDWSMIVHMIVADLKWVSSFVTAWSS
mmetsp:Transcript_27503/g.39374  ORF Transcript_27503/g.39374 Transcript_27503/m.39374 type:complete len:539 (+) Transcript_27503:180-1796(+)